MATAFKNYTARSIGTTAYYVISQNSGTFNGGITSLTSGKAVIMVGCMVSNRLTSSITVDVAHYQNAGSKTTYLCKALSIPAGDAIEVVRRFDIINPTIMTAFPEVKLVMPPLKAPEF